MTVLDTAIRSTILLLLLLSVCGAAQQIPCELVPEEQFPHCPFTERSNYGFRGPVHTQRLTTRFLSPDPREREKAPRKAPKLQILQQSPAWIVFTADGDIAEIASMLRPDGSPQ